MGRVKAVSSRVAWFGFFVSVFLIGFSPLRDADLFLYLAIAREILRHGFTSFDPFVVMSGFPWVVHHEWLGQMLFYGSYKILGYDGPIVLKIAVAFACLTPGFLWLRAKGLLSRPDYFAQFFLGLLAVSMRFGERTSAFGDLFLVAFLTVLILDLREVLRAKWFLPLITVLWVNTHGSWPLLFGFGLWWVVVNFTWGRAGALTASLLAALLNPEGAKGLTFPFRLLGESHGFLRNNIVEFLPTLSPLLREQWQVWVFMLFLLLSVALMAQALKGQRFSRANLTVTAIALGLLVESLLASRFMPSAVFGLITITSALARPREEDLRWPVLQLTAVASFLLVTLTGNYSRFGQSHVVGGGIDARVFPTETVKALKTYPGQGATLNAYYFGGILAWELDGRRKIFVHGFFSDMTVIDREFLYLGQGRPVIDSLTAKYGFDTILIERTALYLPVIQALESHPGWRLAVVDPASVLFIRQ